MDPYLLDLLMRMSERSDRIISLPDGAMGSNPDAKFIKAFDEARTLNQAEYVPALCAFVEKSKDEEIKQSAYKCLSFVYKNTNETAIINYLIARLAVEKKDWTLWAILSGIHGFKKPIPMDVEIGNILALTSHKKHLVRDMAIQSLQSTGNPQAEEKLIEIITNNTDKYLLVYANATIRKIGTVKSIPALLKLTEHKKEDVAATALMAILDISDQSFLPLFIKHLQTGKQKYLGLEGVVKYGGIAESEYVIKRVKELVSKKRNVHFILQAAETELTLAMRFLSAYSRESKKIKELYQLLNGKKSDLLWPEEKKWLAESSHLFE